eukprot:9547030-Alexandrium_andersonii.AAC.1
MRTRSALAVPPRSARDIRACARGCPAGCANEAVLPAGASMLAFAKRTPRVQAADACLADHVVAL